MMILFNSFSVKNLSEFGISVPLLANRGQIVFNKLKGRLNPNCFLPEVKKTMTKEDLLLAHDQSFIQQIFNDPRQLLKSCYEGYIDSDLTLEMGKRLVNKTLIESNATFHAALSSLDHQFVFHLGGGMHHAGHNYTHGFCLINDCVVAINKLKQLKKIELAWLIDTDAHFSDGVADMRAHFDHFRSLSIHMKKGWPKSKRSEQKTYATNDIDLDIDECEEGLYLTKLEHGLKQMKKLSPTPDIAFVIAGSDPYEHDELLSASLIKLTKQQMLARDMLVYDYLSALKIPQIWVMAGGYGKRAYEVPLQFLNSVLS